MKARFLLFAFFLLANCISALAQCSMCAATIEANSREGGAAKAEGLNTGILWLMSFPYVLFVVIGVIWYRSAQRKKGSKTVKL